MTAQKYEKRKDNVCKIVHSELCGKCGLERVKHGYDHKLEGVTENESTKILWDLMVQCDQEIAEHGTDIVKIYSPTKNRYRL